MKAIISVVIVGTNDSRWLLSCLNSINLQCNKFDLNLIYVDNCSSDNSLDIVRSSFEFLHIISLKENRGYSGANNEGIKKALRLSSKYIFLINPDTKLPKNLIDNLCHFMDTNPQFAIVGPIQRAYCDRENGSTPNNFWSNDALKRGSDHVFQIDLPNHRICETPYQAIEPLREVVDCYYVQGCALFIRSSSLGSLRFNEDYHTFYEEVDLCRELLWRGYRIGIVKNLYIMHFESGSTNESFYKIKHMTRNKYYFLLTDPAWSWKNVSLLFRVWIYFDLFNLDLKKIYAFTMSIFFLIYKFPKIMSIRKARKRMHPNRHVELRPISKK